MPSSSLSASSPRFEDTSTELDGVVTLAFTGLVRFAGIVPSSLIPL